MTIDGVGRGKKAESCFKMLALVTCNLVTQIFQYTEGMMVELDVLIIGGYYGEGRRRGLISQFLLGVADTIKNQGNFFFHSCTKCDFAHSKLYLSLHSRQKLSY